MEDSGQHSSDASALRIRARLPYGRKRAAVRECILSWAEGKHVRERARVATAQGLAGGRFTSHVFISPCGLCTCRVEEEDIAALSEGVVITTSQQRGTAQVWGAGCSTECRVR